MGFGYPESMAKNFISVKTACYEHKEKQWHNFEKTGQKRRKSAFLGESKGVEKYPRNGPRLWNTETKLVSGERLNCRAS